MVQTVTVTRKDVQQIAELAFPDYRGPKHQVCVTDSHTIYATDLCSSGGTVSKYVALRILRHAVMASGVSLTQRMDNSGIVWERQPIETVSPWSGDKWSGTIPDDVILVEYKEFRGKVLGLRYYMSPNSQFIAGQKLLQAAPELTKSERTVLEALCSLKGGHYRQEAYDRAGLTPNMLVTAIQGLIAKGLAKRNKVGATSATTAGENARRALPPREPEITIYWPLLLQ